MLGRVWWRGVGYSEFSALVYEVGRLEDEGWFELKNLGWMVGWGNQGGAALIRYF